MIGDSRERGLPGVAVMKNSASSSSDGFLNVWKALGGTTMSSPAEASIFPSGVSNLTVPETEACQHMNPNERWILFYSQPLVTRKHSSWKRCQCIGGPLAPLGSSIVTHPTRLSVLLPSSKI